MAKVITFSQVFPGYHPRAGEPTFFIEKMWKGFEKQHRQDGTYSIYIKHPKLLKSGYWQIPITWRDQMIDNSFKPKFHTIRAGFRFKVGEKFSPRVWKGRPYNSKQVIIGPDIEIKKIWSIEVNSDGCIWIVSDNDREDPKVLQELAKNDGLTLPDLLGWFNKPMIGQIICWNEKIEY